jgi:hypothetical protein
LEHRDRSKVGKCFSNAVTTPISSGYRPELGVSSLLNPIKVNYYHNLIGIIRWAVELGQIDIYIHVSMLLSFLASPREGHLAEVIHIFAYLKKHKCSTMVFDETQPHIDESSFIPTDWTEFY